MNILITGHDGFIANAILGKLKQEGNFMVGLEKEKNTKKIPRHSPDVEIIGDMRDYDLLRRLITEYEIDEIYHLASWPIASVCANDPYTTFDINIMGLVKLLEAIRHSGYPVKNIVISTSDKAFGNSPVPYTEKSALSPLFSYDTSKACQQMIALCYFRNYKLPIKVVACSNIYGPGDYNFSRVIPRTIARLHKGKPAWLWRDSENHIREFVYIDDCADAFLTAGKNGISVEVYCCGGTEYLKIKDLMEKMCVLMNKDPIYNVQTGQRPVNLMEIEEQYIDSTKLRSIGWSPKVSLDDGIRRSIEFYTNLIDEKKLDVE